MTSQAEIISVSPENVATYGLFCIKSKKNPGYSRKLAWFLREYPKGLRLKILQDKDGRQLGFIEFTPAEQAWRPVEAPGHIFIHCMYIYKKEDKGQGYASLLIKDCIADARRQGKQGVAVLASNGPWIASKDIFIKNGFKEVGQRDGFELLQYSLVEGAEATIPTQNAPKEDSQAWQLFFSDQCPWHYKCTEELLKAADSYGVELQVQEVEDAAAAREGLSTFGTFALVKEGELLEYHYISKTRFKNILKAAGEEV